MNVENVIQIVFHVNKNKQHVYHVLMDMYLMIIDNVYQIGKLNLLSN